MHRVARRCYFEKRMDREEREKKKSRTRLIVTVARWLAFRFVTFRANPRKNCSPVRCFRGQPGGSEPAELSRWISPGTLGHARAYAKHRRALPQIHGEADGAEVTIEEHVAEFTEHARDGRSDDGRRWAGDGGGAGWPPPRRRPRCRRGGRVPGRRGDQKTIDGKQAAGELRLGPPTLETPLLRRLNVRAQGRVKDNRVLDSRQRWNSWRKNFKIIRQKLFCKNSFPDTALFSFSFLLPSFLLSSSLWRRKEKEEEERIGKS